jgi:hypothetical protein
MLNLPGKYIHLSTNIILRCNSGNLLSEIIYVDVNLYNFPVLFNFCDN